MVGLAQMVRASDCGPEGRRFDPDIPPHSMPDGMRSSELRFVASVLRYNSDIPPHIVQISARRCFFDSIYREERADFAGSTLFVLKSVTSSVAGLFFSTKAP